MCQMTLYLGNRAKPLRELAGMGCAGAKRGEGVKDRDSGQNQQCAPKGVAQILGESEVQENSGSEDKERWNDGIAPSAIGTLGYFAAPEDEDCASGNHIKQPFRKNRQRKELPE